VLDQLWQSRARVSSLHVDGNWYELGDLPFDFAIDSELAAACIAVTPRIGVRSKGVDYDGLPLDSEPLVASELLDPEGRLRLLLASNNLSHDWSCTEALSRLVADAAARLGLRYAVVGVGGLSSGVFRTELPFDEDQISYA
jgi:2-aminophenol/2-amino-5-chlorophenol 1,6-dioxygenase alpha subunit